MPKNNKYYHPDADFYRKELKTAAPQTFPHETEEEIRKHLKELKPDSWRLEGNRLIGSTEMGELVQIIPTDYILTGTDSRGLPVFKKVVL